MVYLSHGVAKSWSPDTIRYALLLSHDRFVSHLQDREQKYVAVSQALSGRGDAFTVDDATYAGFRAVMLARAYGHQVSWYVNGFHVQHQVPYFPFQLSAMLDRTMLHECVFRGTTWCLARLSCRRRLRGFLKKEYMQFSAQWQVAKLVGEVAAMLHVDPFDTEADFRTVSEDELRQAVAAGVDVQNHGWTHLNPLALSVESRTAELLQNERWLEDFRTPGFRVYAPPYGAPVSLLTLTPDSVLLAHRGMGGDWRDRHVVNRQELQLNDGYKASASYALKFEQEAMVQTA